MVAKREESAMARHLVVAHQTAASPEPIQRARNLEAQDPEAQFILFVLATPVRHLLRLPWEEGEVREIARRQASGQPTSCSPPASWWWPSASVTPGRCRQWTTR
jgi:hypothetical protein